MRLYFRVFSFLPFLLIVWQMSSAEEIIRQGRNRFATHKTELNEKISENRRIRIQSVESLRGKLYITSADVDRAHLEYKKLLRTSEKAEALDYAELIQVTFRDTPSGLELLFQTLNPSPWSRTDNSAGLSSNPSAATERAVAGSSAAAASMARTRVTRLAARSMWRISLSRDFISEKLRSLIMSRQRSSW